MSFRTILNGEVVEIKPHEGEDSDEHIMSESYLIMTVVFYLLVALAVLIILFMGDFHALPQTR